MITRPHLPHPGPSTSSLPARVLSPRTRWTRRTSFRLVVATQVLLFAGSNFPTPLFPLYEHRYGFGSGTVTLLFGAYVGVLVPTLLVLGRLTDRIGRRMLLAAGMAITALSSLAFAAAQGVTWLFAGEIVYGVGAGLVMSCVAAAITELHPARHVASAALAASVAGVAGMTLGPLVSGLLASFTPWPSTSPYALDIVLATLLAAALLRIPESRPTPAAGPSASAIHIPAEIRTAFLAPAMAGASTFMVVGWVFGLAPSYLHEELHVHVTQPVVAGLFAALVVFVNGVTQIVLRRHHHPTALRLSLSVAVVGMATMASSTLVDSLALATVGAVVAGAGTGVAQMNAMATIQRIAPAHARGTVTSTYFTLCYLAVSVPVIVAGRAADHVGLGAVTAWYGVGLAVFVGAALWLGQAGRYRPARDHAVLGAPDRPPLALRPLEPTDRDAIAGLFDRLSPRSRYLRFCSPIPRVPSSTIDHLASIDHLRHEAVGVFAADTLVGAAHFFRSVTSPARAEISVEVDDDHQRQGLGTWLLRDLADRAGHLGITHFTATVLDENAGALSLVRGTGWTMVSRVDGGALDIIMALPGDPVPGAAEDSATRAERSA